MRKSVYKAEYPVVPENKVNPPKNGRSVLIIGAGYAGAGAAFALKRLGYDVTVITNEDRLGGNAKTVIIDNEPLDVGAQWFLRHDKNCLRLARHFRLPLIKDSLDVITVIGSDTRTTYKRISVVSFLKTLKFLSRGSLQILWRLMKYRWGAVFWPPTEGQQATSDMSAKEYFQGKDLTFFNQVVYPIWRSLTGNDPSQCSAKAVLQIAADYMFFGGSVYRVKNGISTLVEKLIEGCRIKLKTNIDRVVYHPEQQYFTLQCAGENHVFDNVIFACPIPEIFKMTTFENGEFSECLRQFSHYKKCLLVFYPLDNESSSGSLSVAFSYPHKPKYVSGILYFNNKKGRLRGTLVAMTNTEQWDYLNSLPENKAAEIIYKEILEYIPKNMRVKVRGHYVQPFNYGFPIYDIGHMEKLRRFDNLKNRVPYVFCGQWRGPFTLEAALQSGLAAAYEVHDNKKEILDLYKSLHLSSHAP